MFVDRFRRCLALVLSCLLCISLFPSVALASDGQHAARDGGIMTMAVPARGVGAVDFSWASTSGVESVDSGGVRTWRVDRTDLRYVEIGVVVNIGSSSSIGTKSVEAVLPYRLDGTGRDGSSGAAYVSHSSVSGLSVSVDRDADEVRITNVSEIAANEHRSMTVFYRFDCWNAPSGKRFDVDCIADVNGSVSHGSLAGAVVTDFDVSVPKTHHSVPAFAFVDTGDHYADRYSYAYEKYFGLTREAFDAASRDWIYDICTITVDPSGQQPYDISGTLVPGRYPLKTDDGNYRPYGWDGQVVAGVCIPDVYGDGKAIPVTIGSSESVRYDQLPNSGSCGSNGSAIQQAEAHTWRKYGFSVDRGLLPVVSKFSDGQVGSYPDYTLSFLVRWPRNSDSIKYANSSAPDKAGYTILNCSVELKHRGVDSGALKSCFDKRQLYFAMMDEVKYGGDIYADTYVSGLSMAESRNGLSQLKAGKKAAVSLTADWYCLNENRAGQVVDHNNYAVKNTYALEAIVDAVLLSEADDHSSMMLHEGDYRISSYGFNVIDNYGNCTKNADGTWNVGWADYGLPEVLRNEPIYVYGSEKAYGNAEADWVLVEETTLGDAWVPNAHRSVGRNEAEKLSSHDFVRLKVVYPNSRLTTAIRLYYEIELLPGGDTVSRIVSNAQAGSVESLSMTSWCNYTAYRTADYANYHTNPSVRIDLDTRRDAITAEDTGSVVRNWDDAHPYPGYSSSHSETGYPYRNFFYTKLSSSSDAVGMAVSQMLFVGDRLVGSDDVQTDAYPMHDAATNVSRVVYRIHGGATDSYESMATVQDRRASDIADGVLSPYTSVHQRYYALLPEGMTLDTDSVSRFKTITCGSNEHTSHYNYVSDVSLGDIPAYLSTGSGIRWTAGHWGDTGYKTDVSYRQVDVGGRELVIFDRSTRYPDSVNSYYTFGNLSGQPRRYLWGLGVEFAAVPKDGSGGLPSGNYETLLLHQFLDGDGDPIPVDGYVGDIYSSAAEAFGLAGGDIDASIGTGPDGGPTFTAIASAFKNRTGSGSSSAEVKVRNDAPEQDAEWSYGTSTEPGTGRYGYELSYRIEDGSSDGVVLWDAIEKYDRNGVRSEWAGTLTGVDLNKTGARVFVNLSEDVDVDSYVMGGGNTDPAGFEWLRDGKHGWTEVANPDGYTGWADVRAIAFWFDGTTFSASKEGGRPDSASVYLHMAAPEEIDGAVAGKDRYVTHNEILFSDHHVETGVSATVLVKPVEVRLSFVSEPADTGFELPSTGGSGPYAYVMAGAAMALFAGLLLVRRRKPRC